MAHHAAPIRINDLRITTRGRWSGGTDPRGVLVLRHPYEPSAAGSGAEARIPLPGAATGRRFLRFYLSDGYAGHPTANAELGYPAEAFPECRFVSVSAGGVELYRADVLGENPPVDERFHQIEIPAGVAGDLLLRVDDVRSVGPPFATDVFWGLLGVVTVPAGGDPPPFGRPDVPAPSLRPVSTLTGARTPVWPALTVRNGSPVDRFEVVTSGVPFPQGRLADVGGVQVTGQDGAILASQQRALARWPDGSVKSLLLDVPVAVPAGGTVALRVEPVTAGADAASGGGSTQDAGASARNAGQSAPDARAPGETTGAPAQTTGSPAQTAGAPAARGGLTVREEGNAITVATGAATFTFGRSPRLLERVELAGGAGAVDLAEPLAQVLNHDGFPSRFAGIGSPERLEIAERGPLRVRLLAEGAYPDVEGCRGLRYVFRFDLCGGSANVRLQHTVVNAGADRARLRALSVRLGIGGLESFDVDGDEGALSGKETWLVQHTHDRYYRWRYADRSTSFAGEGGQNRGYAWARGPVAAGLSLRHMAVQHPNGFRIDPAGLQVDLWTSDRIPWVLGSDPPLELAEGEAKTHDLLLAFGPADAGPELAARLQAFKEPLFAAASPAWYSASGAFGPIAVEDPARFPEYEAGVAAMDPGAMGHGRGGPWNLLVAHTHEERDTYQRYGFRHFGDNPLIWGYQTQYRMWANCEYDVAHCAFTQFARSGDLRYLWRGRQACWHNRDTDVIHASAQHPEWVGAPHGHWIDHAERAPNLGHLWTEGMVADYLLTGDERSLQVARGVADYCVRYFAGGWKGSGERTAGWPMIALLGVWHGTGDERYLQAARRLKDDVLEHQDDLRGVWSYKIYEQPAYEGGTVFMVDILSRALMRYHLATGDEAAAAAIVRAAQWVRWEAVTDSPEAPQAFYKQTPRCSRLGECTPETFACAYALTGDAQLGDLAWRAYRAAARSWSGGVPTAKMRDLPRVMALLGEEPGS